MSSTIVLVFGIILLAVALFLIVAVLMQQGKSHNLSGTIAGGAETFFGKEKGKAANKALSIATSVIAIVFVLIVLGFYVSQATTDYSSVGEYFSSIFGGEKTEAVDTGASTDTTGSVETDEHGHAAGAHDHE